MKGGGVLPYLRNKLNQPGENDNHGRRKMHGDSEVAHGIAGNISMRYVVAPGPLRSPSRGCHTVERRYGKREYQLADDHHPEPKPDGCFKGSLRDVLQ
jgi:hypothetical protein